MALTQSPMKLMMTEVNVTQSQHESQHESEQVSEKAKKWTGHKTGNVGCAWARMVAAHERKLKKESSAKKQSAAKKKRAVQKKTAVKKKESSD
eukprot:gene17150-2724_t